MHTSILRAAVAALTVAAASTAAHAQTYVSVGTGSGRLNVDCTGASSCDKAGSAFKLMGGYQFDGWSLEAGYLNFGKAVLKDGSDSLAIKNTALVVAGAFHLPMGANWDLGLRLGAARVSTQVDVNVVNVGSGSAKDSHVATLAGLSLGYKFNDSLSLELATDVTQAKFNQNGLDLGSGNLRSITLGLRAKF